MENYKDATRAALFQLQEAAVWTDEIFQDTEYAMELDRRNVILEGVMSRFRMLGIGFEEADISSILKELNNRYVLMGASDGVPKAVTNWIRKGEPANPNPPYRNNLYDLCFALEMSLNEVEAFFLKYYMTIPFNYKDPIDATYYYSLKMNKTYTETRKLLDTVDSFVNDRNATDEMTNAVHYSLDEIQDDDLFLAYLRTNSFSKDKQFQTVRTEIERLVVLNAKWAESEASMRDELDDERNHHQISREDGKVNYKELLRIIYGFDNQSYYGKGENVGAQRLSENDYLPKRFKRGFPRDQEFSNIKDGKASAEVCRKALVIMKFYNYFGERLKSVYDFTNRSSSECKEDFEEFLAETSACLAKCGFVALYPRNPFDWMILYCAHCDDPLFIFRQVLRRDDPKKHENS